MLFSQYLPALSGKLRSTRCQWRLQEPPANGAWESPTNESSANGAWESPTNESSANGAWESPTNGACSAHQQSVNKLFILGLLVLSGRCLAVFWQKEVKLSCKRYVGGLDSRNPRDLDLLKC
jgi:hypothetical protein